MQTFSFPQFPDSVISVNLVTIIVFDINGRKCRYGVVTIGDFRQIASYKPISKTVQDSRIVSIKVE